ncbi:MAG: hypothetical protein IAE80_30370 [Anaerolinea sp.]|nr:hypothetical protein [Anaerolinea sp.]
MQNWNRNRTQVTRTWLIMALVVGGLLLAACAPSATPVAQPNGGSPKPTHTAAFAAATEPAQAAEQFMRTFYTADYHDRDQWLARLMPLASEDGYSILKSMVAPALWPDLEQAQTVVKAEQVTVTDRGLKAEGVSKMMGNTPWQIRAVTVALAPETQWPGLTDHIHATNVLLSQETGVWKFVMLLSDEQAKQFQTKGAK